MPPITILKEFLKKHGNTMAIHKTICTDEGGELWGITEFKQAVMQAGYVLQPTAPGAPFQNGLAERPNQTYSTMVRCLLHSANLGHEYWSYALLHAVYLKNRLPHTATKETPYKAYTGSKPSAKNLRVFGCPVIVKHPGKRPTKLDLHTSAGRFLGYTATDKNIYYIDNTTRRIKIATHCTFDVAGMTLPPLKQSPASKALQQAGFTQSTQPDTDNSTTTPTALTPQPDNNSINLPYQQDDQLTLSVKLLSANAHLPTRATQGAAGYNVYSATTTTLQPGQQGLFPLDIQLTPPTGTYI
jgi:hypothetical protein